MPRLRPAWFRMVVACTLLALVGPNGAALAQTPIGSGIVVDPVAQDGLEPELSADAEGNFVVVWEERELVAPGNDFDLFARFYRQDGTPRGARVLATAEGSSQSGAQHSPVASHNVAGATVVAWVHDQFSFGFGNTLVQAQRFTPAGSKVGARFTIAEGSRLAAPTLLHLPSGGYFAAWNDVTAGLVRLRRFVGAKSDGPIVTIGVGSEPALSIAPDGSLVMAFVDAGHVFARRLDAAGQPLGSPIDVGEEPASFFPFIGSPRVAHASDGSFAVVWYSGDDFLIEHDVFLRRYSAAGAPLGGTVTVNTTLPGSQREPDLAHDGQGGYVVVWCEGAGSVAGRRFDESGVPTSGEFPVDIATSTDLQSCTAVDAFRGRFVATWGSEAPGGVIAQRFSTPAKVPSLQAVGAWALWLSLGALGVARARRVRGTLR